VLGTTLILMQSFPAGTVFHFEKMIWDHICLRVFFRNAINVALPVLESEDAGQIHDGDLLEIDLSHISVRNLTRGKEYSAAPYPDYVQQIMDSGGIVEFARKKLKGK
jgi:3-isopropylmalate/(R)-2-methylmalate dehydratase small subunit